MTINTVRLTYFSNHTKSESVLHVLNIGLLYAPTVKLEEASDKLLGHFRISSTLSQMTISLETCKYSQFFVHPESDHFASGSRISFICRTICCIADLIHSDHN